MINEMERLGKRNLSNCYGGNTALHADAVKNYRSASPLACKQGLLVNVLIEEKGPC